MDREQYREWVKKVAQRSVLSLPPLPTLVAKLIELIDDPMTNAARLGKLISTDQVLTTRVLKFANSAYYGCSQRISTLSHAVFILGFDTVKDMCLGVTVRNWFNREQDTSSFDMSRFWEHSVTCGIASKLIAHECGYRKSGETFVAGLIHDIGKLVIKQHLRSEFRQILDEVNKNNCLFVEAEQQIFGITHAEIGKILADHWKLPAQLSEAIAFHHEPEKAAEHFAIAAIVHFANFLTRASKIGNSGDSAKPKLSPKAAEFLKLRRKEDQSIDLWRYTQILLQDLDKAETFLSVIQGEETPYKIAVP